MEVVVTLTVVLGAGLVAQSLADALRLPRVLALVAGGIVIGPSVLGLASIAAGSGTSHLLLTLGVALILFSGGLQLSVRVLRPVWLTLVLLGIPGVLLTTVITGAVAARAFGLPMIAGLLIGAALAPTDPAILIPLLERIKLEPRLTQTIIAESALNDPVGAVLALGLVGAALSGVAHVDALALAFIRQLGISTGIGLGMGGVLSLAISTHRWGLLREAAPVAVLATVAGSYLVADVAGGSGYLVAFIMGLLVGNVSYLRLTMHRQHRNELDVVVRLFSDVIVLFIFTVLGISLPLPALAEHGVAALAVLAALVLVARPVTVVVCTHLDRRGGWSWRETVLLAWTRETGVVPAALSVIVANRGVPHAEFLSTCVVVTLLGTLTVQATTKRWLARRLGLVSAVPP